MLIARSVGIKKRIKANIFKIRKKNQSFPGFTLNLSKTGINPFDV